MAILTFVSLPWMALAASRVGADIDALGGELIKPLYMTGIEAGARVIAAVMALGIVWNTIRLWTRLAGGAGWLAGAIVAGNATLVYYAHTGNLEVPYLFWITWSLVEMDRVICGEPREIRVLLLALAAVLTKDQAAAALILPLPLALAVIPALERGASLVRSRMLLGTLLTAGIYGLVSGAVTNPSGFRRRIAFLLGPASQSWAGYSRDIHGRLQLLHDALTHVPHFASWPLWVAAVFGVVVAAFSDNRVRRARRLVPLLASVSFSLFFTMNALRSEDRFLLPQSLFFFPYAAVAFDAARTKWPRLRWTLSVACALALAAALLAVASTDATLLNDSRYEAERFLRALPGGSHVEVYGGPIFLPRIPSALVAIRPGVEPLADRQFIAGVDELVDPKMDPQLRAPTAIVLATELSNIGATEPPGESRRFALAQYGDKASHAFFHGLFDGSLGYARTLRASCSLPWPLQCRKVHGSTGEEVWIYVRQASSESNRHF